jgi:electron transfer flavoprotein beta subunit
VEKGKYDLILTGAQADDGAGPGGRHAGGHAGLALRLAGQQDRPWTAIKLKVGREIEGGNQEMNEIELPCVLSIQTGINEPRYVGIRGIRKVASVEIPTHGAGRSGRFRRQCRSRRRQGETPGLLRAEMGEGAEMLEGSTEEIIDKLIELLKAKGGLK